MFRLCEDKKLIIEVFYDYFKIKKYGSVKKYIKQRYVIFKNKGYETLFLDINMWKTFSTLKKEEILKNFYKTSYTSNEYLLKI